ncbi:hypothetical protein KKB28_04905, partial [bacterium]|nr:hypothetical protein [bacterium]
MNLLVTKQPNPEEPNCCFLVRKRTHRAPIFYGLEIDAPKLQALQDEYDRRYGCDNRRRDSSWKYNCHGLTFAQRIGWIGVLRRFAVDELWTLDRLPVISGSSSDQIEALLKLNNYLLLAQIENREIDEFLWESDVRVGDTVIYRDVKSPDKRVIEHSSIVVYPGEKYTDVQNSKCYRCKIRVLSKFGAGPEYFHNIKDVPDCYGKYIEIWTDR